MEWTSEHRLVHPSTGLDVFGKVPEIAIRRGPTLPAGPIYLKYGEHRGKNLGFGFQHVWKEHCPHIIEHDVALKAVIAHIAKALPPSAPLFFETGRRLEVYRIQTGRVIIELFNANTNPYYSVVSSGYRPSSAAGSRVGYLERSQNPNTQKRQGPSEESP